ncbi:nuclear transport factor 2 family protein [Marinomonas sp. UCMA 3892]|nr:MULTISPECIES: nuclear transport factor 2 family protein [unclassified Marinomonas]MBU1294988.1 nuclear transport factor 2 family protein [Gammaproteobacteria bacterium]MBU1468005.1 nuclear transport factor 2 family protein [Gammaproteobacteria bacterium]MBU2024563.1 nuclear transport factor 2 family protein [Gammaproteobacteria bacterium]MBU2238464.1 nuclear transport factor 2 family protein [Gammaproteobacteria bacterium]MBU2318851.1 nuclear transport factor 2 family protein [Gammaproteoba
MTDSKMDPNSLLIERFKAFYLDVKHPKLDKIDDVYTEDVLFKDPVHELRGAENLHAYLSEMCVNVHSGRFEYLDQIVSENTAYIKWNMHFKHPKLGNKTITVRGISQVQFNERIYFHEDVYDLGQLIYEHVPLLGAVVKGLKKRLAN